MDACRMNPVNLESRAPIYTLPWQPGQQRYQTTSQGSSRAAGKERNLVLNNYDAAEIQPLDQWVQTNLQKRVVTKKRKLSNRLVIIAHQVLYDRQWCLNCGVIIENGYIRSVKAAASIEPQKGDIVHVYPSATLSPGFIDLLIHGADGHDVMHSTVESMHGIASKLVEEGTTAFLPSTMTASVEAMQKVARVIHESMQTQNPGQAAILGWHAEGPYFAREKIGCHDLSCQRNPSFDEVIQWQKASGYSLKIITVAPELPEALPFIRWASDNGIVISIGHTMAHCDQTYAAIDHGATMATHLYNAMENGSHKKAGCSTGIKTHPKGIYYTLIVDGVHIDSPMILELSGQQGFTTRGILITDGIMAKYKADGTYVFGGQEIVVNGKVARLMGKDNLAGSILKMNEAVANVLTFAPNISLADALLMASYNPARAISAFGKGLVSEGYDADITLLDNQYNVLATYRSGRMVYQLPGVADFYELTY